jgi:hypothetical protein
MDVFCTVIVSGIDEDDEDDDDRCICFWATTCCWLLCNDNVIDDNNNPILNAITTVKIGNLELLIFILSCILALLYIVIDFFDWQL